MTTLMIKDLAVTADLDRKAMSAVHGGTGSSYSCAPAPAFCGTPAPYPSMPSYDWPVGSISKSDFNFNASQMLGQTQNTVVNNGNNVAFSSGITANVSPYQNGQNTINLG